MTLSDPCLAECQVKHALVWTCSLSSCQAFLDKIVVRQEHYGISDVLLQTEARPLSIKSLKVKALGERRRERVLRP